MPPVNRGFMRNIGIETFPGPHCDIIFLQNDAEETKVEIGLGVENNELSFVRISGSSSSFETATPNLLHCDDTRAFWISWNDEYFKVGKGSMIDEQVFMNLQDPNRDSFNAVQLHSVRSSSAVWQIYENSGTIRLHAHAVCRV